MKKITQFHRLRWCSPVKHFALSRRRSRVQIPAGAILTLRLRSPENFLILYWTCQNIRWTVTFFIVLYIPKGIPSKKSCSDWHLDHDPSRTLLQYKTYAHCSITLAVFLNNLSSTATIIIIVLSLRRVLKDAIEL